MATSNKRQRYDRQLRLWETSGQAALEKASICAIGSCVMISEALKNLVLPGIGSYTIIDNSRVNEQDLVNNFFARDLSKYRAENVCQNLNELNHDVKSVCICDDVSNIIHKNSSFFDNFTLVLASNLDVELDERISNLLFNKNIPFVVVDSIGFYSIYRVILNNHRVIDTHPDNLEDLRLDCPWDELVEYAKSINLDDNGDVSHIPYIILLLKYTDVWKYTHNGNIPKSRNEKNQFKLMILSNSPNQYEENYQEAISNAWKISSSSSKSIPSDILKLVNEAKTRQKQGDIFWILLSALGDFINSNQLLPLSGIIHDMKSDSHSFIQLSKIYQDKAKKDAQWVHNRAIEIITQTGENLSLSFKETALFCKHSRFIKLINGHNLQTWYTNLPNQINDDSDDDDTLQWILLVLQATRIFKHDDANGQYPNGEKDVGELVGICCNILSTTSIKPIGIEICQEVCRAGGDILHNIAAFTGGITGQEIIKLITGQYIPANNTVVFDGIKSQSKVFFV